MSEGDVSLIRDEDVLRRMWQQTEDFSRKKEIRAHMYRLREERLRNLYSPEPGVETKGCEFTSTQGHVKSFADQNFQSMKSKEVRDAGSPPKEFTYHGQDLNALSNAGWNVESENRTTDDGHTHVKSVHANIEGRYDVDGGHGQFAAVDHNKQAVTEYDDGNTSLKRNENISNTAAHEQVMRKTDDGTHFSSTKSSSSSTSKVEQFSSKREAMPYETVEDFDFTSNKIYDNNRHDTNRSEEITSNKFTRTSDYEENLRNDYDNGELVSRKIDYPDENTKVIVETRCLPNGTRVTSTRREFRAPSTQTSHSEKQSHQTRSESKSSYTSSQKRSHINESSTNILRETIADTTDNIVDSQKNIDDYDFQKNNYSLNRNNENNFNNQYRNQSTHESRDNKNIRQEVVTSKNDDYTQQRDITNTQSVEDNENRTHHINNKTQNAKSVEDKYNYISEPVRDVQGSIYNIRDNTEYVIVEDRENKTTNKNQSEHNIEERHHNVTREDVVVERKTSTEKYQSTYQTDFTQKKISNDWSPAQQAWASTLRSDTPTRPSTRASSPGSKTFKSSTSSLRSSVSPDKTNKKTSRGGSPSKIDRVSPTRPISEKHPSMNFTPSAPENKNKFSSPDRKSPETYRSRSSTSPEKTFNKSSSSPVKKPEDSKPDNYVRTKSPSKSRDKSVSPQRSSLNYNKEPVNQIYTPIKYEEHPRGFDEQDKDMPKLKKPESYLNEDLTPKPNNVRNTYSPEKTKPAEEIQRKPSLSPDRKNKHSKPSSPTKSATEPIQRHFKEPSPTKAKPLAISDNQPGYMRPTASSKPKSTDNSAPVNEYPEPSSKSPDRKTHESTVNRIKEDHYKFIDEETKMYSVDESRQTVQMKKINISSDKKTTDSPRNKEFSRDRSCSPDKNSRQSLSRKSPVKDVPIPQPLPTENDSLKVRVSPSKILNSKTQSSESPINSPVPKEPRLQSKSPSPTRKTLTNSEPQFYSDTRSEKSKSPSPDKFSSTRCSPNKDRCFPDSIGPKNENDHSSELNNKHEPNKYVNTDSKFTGPSKATTRNKEQKINTKDKPSPDRNSYPFDSTSIRSRTPSPIKNTSQTTKVQSVDIKKHITSKNVETSDIYSDDLLRQNNVNIFIDKDSKAPRTQSRQSSKDKSPRKSPVKFSETNTFIELEKTNEEFTKNTLKERPRQLITPSTSPTRKPKITEKTPLSGQSSPTTSVSGFEYYPSDSNKTVVTDLDEQLHSEYTKEYTKTINENLKDSQIQLSTSSKIPCRSPSPEKRPTKETLPRKSSLKKTSNNQISPTEKPPSSFLVSPNIESKEFVDQKVIIKDNPSKENAKPIKTKPPFERRETYEERCRKILGMVETDTNESETMKITTDMKTSFTNMSSPSVSPCRSPTFDKENSPNENFNKIDTTKNEEIVSHEIKEDKQTTISLKDISDNRKASKIPTRDLSPTKLQDIPSIPENKKYTKDNILNIKNDSVKSTAISTEETSENTFSNKSYSNSKYTRSSLSPEKTTGKKTSPYITTTTQIDEIDNQIPHREQQTKPRNPVEPSINQEFKHIDSPERNPIKTPNEKSVDRFSKIPKDNSITANDKEIKQNVAIVSSEYEIQHTTESLIDENIDTIDDEVHYAKSKTPLSPERKIPAKISSPIKHVNVFQQQENVTNKKSNINTDFISSEKEKEVLDRVQKSLRKLSPDRTNKFSHSEKDLSDKNIPASTNLQDLEIVSLHDRDITASSTNTVIKSVKNVTNDESKYTEKQTFEKDKKISNKPPSRNASPTKKSSNVSPVPVRSISPKKPLSPTERPQSPSIPKISGVKSREQIASHIRKPSPSTGSTSKVEKTVTDIKKATSTNKQSNNTKIVTNKYASTRIVPVQTSINKDQEPKRVLPSKTSKDSVRKDLDTKVSRTVSDLTLKTKKSSPQRMKSKPEIQVNDVTPGKLPKHTTTSTKVQKISLKEQQIKLPTSKPKSATALNTSTDEDDVIIDVQQAKSSRENSPDRICPTPVGFSEDIGTPRFPDEVSEPDDEYQKRTYQTIHEAESIVDDIVEINEDDELFVKKTDTEETAEEILFSINDKVTRPTTKIENDKTKATTARFRETEKQVHSDFIDDNLKSDDCLLSVSEKVNKFAKGPCPTKDNRSPSRNIVEEYDKHTTYQDDYTKLSVNDKAHLFIETAENVKTTKIKPTQKVERPDLSDVDDTLRSDECLLSVSDKVNKFVKTAEQFLNESYEIEEKEKKIKEQHEKIMKKIVENIDESVLKTQHEEHLIETTDVLSKTKTNFDDRQSSFARETIASNAKGKDHSRPNLKPVEKSSVKITTLRSSDAVKKAKALFENIASTTATTTHKNINTKSPRSVDKTVTKKVPKVDSVNIHQHPTENESETPKKGETIISHASVTINHSTSSDSGKVLKELGTNHEETPHASPARLKPRSPERVKSKSPILNDTNTITQIRTSIDFPKHSELEADKPEKQQEKVIPNYQRPTKTSQNKEETKVIEETETVSSRRGSGKFGVELRRMSNERSTPSNERRRSSVEHHQPCIEDIYDVDLLEQMLEKVVGYEQRRRIRAQIRVAKKRIEKEEIDTHTSIKTKHTVTRTNKLRSPERHHISPERLAKVGTKKTDSPDRHTKTTQKFSSPDRDVKSTPEIVLPKLNAPLVQNKSLLNGHVKDPHTNITDRLVRPQSPAKLPSKISSKPKSPVRQHSPEKKSRPLSPAKSSSTKPKSNRFNEYASAYMKKVGLKESDKIAELKTKKNHVEEQKTRKIESHSAETKFSSTTTKKTSERTISKDKIDSTRINEKRSPSPEHILYTKQYEQENRIPERQNSPNRKTQSPERIPQSPERRQKSPLRSPSPEMVRQKSDIVKTQMKKETIIKTVYDIEKKIPQTVKQEEKPSWITNRNLKKTSDTRTFATKKAEPEKSKYRPSSPSKVISKPIDVITSSYGPGPLDADGRPLFGIKALRNGSSNYQVKGTVIRQEFHSRNGGEPEGTVSVTAYSTEPEDLEKLLQSQGEKPSRIHGLAAITTTKKFGGDTGTSYSEVHNKEERAVLDQFTHSDRKVSESRITSKNFDRTDEFIHKEKQISDNDRYAQRNRVEIIDGETEKGYKEINSEKETVNKQNQKMQSEKARKVELERRGRERMEKSEKREEKKTVRQSSVKSLTEKYIKSANETSKSERHVYPKAGLILRTSTMKDSVSSDSSAHAGLTRTDSEHSLGSDEEVVTTTTTEQIGDGVKTTTTTTSRSGHTRATERSFLDSSTKVTGVQDILTRMKNADIVIEEGDSSADTEARALLNKFLGATVLMAGMQNYVTEKPTGKVVIKQETVQSSGGKVTSSRHIEEFDIDQCWDERVLRKLLDECTDYEQRRRLRARIRTLMAEQEACASAVTEALAAAGETVDAEEQSGEREEEEVTTVTSSVRRNSSEKTVSSSTTTIKNSKVIESMTRPAPKPVSPFAKFRQLEKQNSTNSPNSPKSPQSPGSPSQPYFKFTDPALQASAVTIKERLLQWCRDKTREYENVKLENFSTSWADGLAFCALVHHFLPNTFDYSKLTPERRRHNFTLAFKVADEKAGIYPLLDVDDMVAMRKPDWKCVFTYVQSIYRRFKDEQ